MVGSFECGKETLGSMKGPKFLDQLGGCLLLKGCARWSLLYFLTC